MMTFAQMIYIYIYKIKRRAGTPPRPHVQEAGSAASQKVTSRTKRRVLERGESTYEVCSQLSLPDGSDDDAAPSNKNTYGSLGERGGTPKAH